MTEGRIVIIPFLHGKPTVYGTVTVQIGAVDYNRCATLGIDEQGLYVSVGGKAALIPRADFKRIRQTTLHWQKMPLLTINEPPVATMAARTDAFGRMRRWLPADLMKIG